MLLLHTALGGALGREVARAAEVALGLDSGAGAVGARSSWAEKLDVLIEPVTIEDFKSSPALDDLRPA